MSIWDALMLCWFGYLTYGFAMAIFVGVKSFCETRVMRNRGK